MKKITYTMLLLFAISSQAQIKKVEIDQNYLVITDTVTSAIEFEMPAADINYSLQGNLCYLSKVYGGGTIYKFTVANAVNAADVVFTDETLRSFLRQFTGFSLAVASASSTGWADYTDNTFTEVSPFNLLAGEKKTLPNNGSLGVTSQLPISITELYSAADTTITGRNGDAILITIEFQVKPTSATADIRVKTTIDIAGAVGEIYPNEKSLTKGNGVEHFFLTTTLAYTLGTWEANGGKIMIEAINGPVSIYNIRFVIARVHKAR